MEKINAKEMPNKFFVRHMNNGLAGYESEKILVSTDTMKRMCKSFDAKPVYVNHQGVDLEKLEEQAAGYVTRCFYNELDGWLWAEIIIVSEEGQEAVRKGLSVSNAYIPTQWGEGGTCHDIAYDREVLEGEFTHLAIVPNPRYEDAIIMTPEEFRVYQDDKKITLEELQNSKKEKNMLKKFFVKKEVGSLEELSNASYTLDDGSEISIGEMIKAVENTKKNEEDDKKAKEEKINMDMEVSVGDEKMSLKELVNRYQDATKEKANADEDEDDKKSKDEAEKANAEEEAKKAKEEDETKKEEKANSKHFDELKNASAFGKNETAKPSLRIDRLARGKKTC